MTTRTSFQSSAPPLLAAPPNRYVDAAVMDYLLIELVPTLRRSSAAATARAKQLEADMIEAGLLPPTGPPVPAKNPKSGEAGKESTNPRDSVGSLNSRSGKTPSSQPPDEAEEALRTRLEAIGVHVGANFAERLCQDRPLFSETLDAIKFICKDVWAACWDKQVDNLRTNHRGVYVLQDNAFKPISRISSHEGRAEASRRARMYVALPAGIIKGALSRLGFPGTVVPEISNLPQCTFQVKLPKAI